MKDKKAIKMKFSERRKHKRFNILDFKIHVLDSIKGDILSKGAIDNFSEYGLCIMTQESLKQGQEITVKDDFSAYPQTAMVRWSKKYNGRYYKSGLKLITLTNNGI